MKTDDLVTLLATGAAPVERHVATTRFSWALVAGALGATLLTVLIYGVRADLATVAATPIFWLKIGLPLAIGAAALLATARLSRPGVRAGNAWAAIAAPVAAVWIAALVLLAHAHAGERVPMLLGATWRVCPLNIALLSVPALVTVFRAIRGLAPTRLRAAGAAGGLLAGATGTLAYCLHCPEMGVPFWAVWYLLGMAIPAALGALAGPRFLRW